MAGQVVGDHHDGPHRVGRLDRGEQALVADRVARGCGQGHRLPSPTRSAPYTQVCSGPRLSSTSALTRWPSVVQPGAGGKPRGMTGPSSSAHSTVTSGGGLVEQAMTVALWGEVGVGAGRPRS